jgi:hypothetical protein
LKEKLQQHLEIKKRGCPKISVVFGEKHEIMYTNVGKASCRWTYIGATISIAAADVVRRLLKGGKILGTIFVRGNRPLRGIGELLIYNGAPLQFTSYVSG